MVGKWNSRKWNTTKTEYKVLHVFLSLVSFPQYRSLSDCLFGLPFRMHERSPSIGKNLYPRSYDFLTQPKTVGGVYFRGVEILLIMADMCPSPLAHHLPITLYPRALPLYPFPMTLAFWPFTLHPWPSPLTPSPWPRTTGSSPGPVPVLTPVPAELLERVCHLTAAASQRVIQPTPTSIRDSWRVRVRVMMLIPKQHKGYCVPCFTRPDFNIPRIDFVALCIRHFDSRTSWIDGLFPGACPETLWFFSPTLCSVSSPTEREMMAMDWNHKKHIHNFHFISEIRDSDVSFRYQGWCKAARIWLAVNPLT